MRSDEIDRLTIKFIEKYYPGLLQQFDDKVLVMPQFASDEMLVMMNDFLGRLSEAFGPNERFIDTEYGDALEALGLEETEPPRDFKEAFRQPIPDSFRKEFEDNKKNDNI